MLNWLEFESWNPPLLVSFLPALRLTTSSIAQLQTSYSDRAETLRQASGEGNPGRGDSLLGSLPVLLGPSIPGGFQAERLTELLENEHGGEKMGEILRSLQTEGRESPYFREVQVYFREFRLNQTTEMSLRRQWQGRESEPRRRASRP